MFRDKAHLAGNGPRETVLPLNRGPFSSNEVAFRVMTPRRSRRRASLVLADQIRPRRRRRSERETMMSSEALDAPVPGALLVLLSRLHRAEPKPEGETAPDAGSGSA